MRRVIKRDRKNLSREAIYSYIRKERDRYYEETKKHPENSHAYTINLNSAFTLLMLLKDLEEIENGSKQA